MLPVNLPSQNNPIPPNPSELLSKPILDELIVNLKSKFDFIIVDTAPVGVVSDSFLLNRIADVNLYIVRSGYTPKKYIEDIAKTIAAAKATFAEMVDNA